MTQIKIITDVREALFLEFGNTGCNVNGCTCSVTFDYPTTSRATQHVDIDDLLTIGTADACNAGTADIVQVVADTFIANGWAESV